MWRDQYLPTDIGRNSRYRAEMLIAPLDKLLREPFGVNPSGSKKLLKLDRPLDELVTRASHLKTPPNRRVRANAVVVSPPQRLITAIGLKKG